MNELERKFTFACQIWQANQTKENADALIKIAGELAEQIEAQPKLKQAADFFKDGDLTKGDRYTKSKSFVKSVQKCIEKSMDWLFETLDFYVIPVRESTYEPKQIAGDNE